ncbi:protein odr-4 homolog [Neolamprologus brichardi]|uniref:protein odr-4 homolog n=1 Tax=Neolamprologus brichardi TaxID=32507 RepID=UPI001643908B|nr:protein odr-4 homolog [Neolamprologus brichardi]
MGRGYIVQDDVEGYLSKLCEQKADPVTGLLIGQSSTQRDYVVMAIRTPQKEESAAAARNSVDKEWVTEHARQVSRMLPGGLSVVGVFIITDADAKDALTTLRQVRVMLTLFPAKSEGLKAWAHQIESGLCLIDGKRLPEDSELTVGQRRNVRQTYTAQLLITTENKRLTDVIQQCGGSVSVTGAIHSRAYLHSNKPKARLAEKLLKRDVVSTVATRVQMMLEELLASDQESKGSCRDKQQRELFCLPHRIFCPLKVSGPLCVCDYQFSDEGLSEVTERLKEMLDIDAAEEDLDTRQETTFEITGCDITPEPTQEKVKAPEHKKNYMGVAMATAVALLATAASMLYLNDI